MEFIKNARDLEIFTIRKAANFPKRYRFFCGTEIAQTASNIHKHAKMGNSVYPVNKHEAQTRRDFFQLALAETQALISQIEVAAELFKIEPASMKFWMEMIWKEDRLLRAIMKTDRQRYKNLPEYD